ncbi:MAG: serine/threonine protein kinase [Myxococcaceae bacterium]|nr:serine/threonine protein kinase [Myxococcaceae bacterium]
MSASGPPLSFGRFVLLELLGRGGMAEVWKAKLEGAGGFSRTVVVKRILPQFAADPHFAQMFQREARLSSQLTHANIVQVFEFGEHAGEAFLAMEYLEGRDLTRTLSAAIQTGVPLGPGLAVFLVREIARALAYAHALKNEKGEPLGLIHRDVSPSNVLLGFDGSVKLLDFGIAKALAETAERTATGTFKGKVGYAAPEHADGNEIDSRADLFALGVVLHEALVLKRLFKGSSDIQTLGLVRQAKVLPPSKQNPAVPPELDRICLKALARLPEDRYPDAGALANDLDPLVHQLQFGPTQLAKLMRTLFPVETRAKTEAVVELATRTVLPARRPLWRLMLMFGALGLVVAIAGLRLWPEAAPPAPLPQVELQPPPPALPVAPPPVVPPPTEVPLVEPAPRQVAPKKVRAPAAKPKRKAADLKGGEVVDPFSR